MICLFKTWHSHIHVKMSQQTGTRYLKLYYPVLWTVSNSSELTTKRTAELAKKKKKMKKNEKPKKESDKFFNLKDSYVKPKHRSEESLRRCRSARTIVKNPYRRSRMVADLDRLSEVEKEIRHIRVLFHSLLSFLYYFHFFFSFSL